MDKLTILQFQLALLNQIEDTTLRQNMAVALYDELNNLRVAE